ncbi:hypothetical protein [Halomontanus rarus]|uniref:hypothetical protein n=1 Tax=Halomontanus rarus TaxID=3034020 RepID=UPI0023E87EF0|nr:hypothetical protein [Halovivax sp. TS33]
MSWFYSAWRLPSPSLTMTRKQSFSRRAILCGIGSASLGTLVPTVAVSATGDALSETDLATAIETGVVEGAELVQEQDVQITQEQVQATADGIAAAVSQSQDVSVEQVQAVATGATEGALLQNQYVNIDQIQAAAGGATEGACTTQVQNVTVEQYQFATAYGAADTLYDHHDKDADTVYDAAKDCVAEEIDHYEKHEGKITKEIRETEVKVEERKRVEVEVEERPEEHKEPKKKQPKKQQPKGEPKKKPKKEKKGKKKKPKKESNVDQSQSVDVSQSQSADTGKGGSVDQSQSVSVDQQQSSSGGGSTQQSQSVDVSQSQSAGTDDDE